MRVFLHCSIFQWKLKHTKLLSRDHFTGGQARLPNKLFRSLLGTIRVQKCSYCMFHIDKFSNPTLLLTTKDNDCRIVILSCFGLKINILLAGSQIERNIFI